MRKTILAGFLLFSITLTGAQFAFSGEPEGKAGEPKAAAWENTPPRALDVKLKTNQAFLKAAKKVTEHGNRSAEGFLKMAEGASKEAMRHYEAGEWALAAISLDESTKCAEHAITLSKNAKDNTIRDSVMQEAILLREKYDSQRKAALAKRRLNDADTFIKTAERLLQEAESNKKQVQKINDSKGEIMKGLDESRGYYEKSKAALENGKTDEALEAGYNAYFSATSAVKDIKKALGEKEYFSKQPLKEEKDIIEFELRKNKTYTFFASEVMKEGDSAAHAMFARGKVLKEEAKALIEEGDIQGGLDKLKTSTSMFIRAINRVSGEDLEKE